MDDKTAQTDAHPLLQASLPRLLSAGRFAASRDVGSHAHAGSELVLVTEGRVRVQVDDTWYPGDAGMLQILPAHRPQIQQTLTYSRTSYCVFHAPPTLFDDSTRVITLQPDDPIFRWMDDLYRLHTRPGPPEPLTTSAILLAILAHLHQLERRETAAARLHPALQRAISRCDTHLHTPLDLTTLAAGAGVSLSHLNALFRSHFGCGPAAYHRRLRLRHAQRLLQNPYHRVNEIARHCGFSDTNYFVRLFHREFGTTPGRWRRSHPHKL